MSDLVVGPPIVACLLFRDLASRAARLRGQAQSPSGTMSPEDVDEYLRNQAAVYALAAAGPMPALDPAVADEAARELEEWKRRW